MCSQQLGPIFPVIQRRKNSNRLTLGPRKPYMHVHVPRFRPGWNFFISTLHTLRPWLDWRLMWVLTSQPKDGGVRRPTKKKIQKGMGRFRPRHFFFILTLHTLRQWLDWPLISVLTLQPKHDMCSGPLKKVHGNVGCFRPGNFFSFWHYTPSDNY